MRACRISILVAILALTATRSVAQDTVSPPVSSAEGATPAPAAPAALNERGEAEAVGPSARPYEELVRTAIAAQEAGDYLGAHEVFAEAHARRPSARTLRGMGVSSFQAGRHAQAIAELKAALAHPERPLDGELRVATEALLARAKRRLGVVVLDITPPSARVFVDGEKEARGTSESLSLDPGTHVLRFEAYGYLEQEIGMDVTAGMRQSLRVRLREAAAPPSTVAAQADAEPAARPDAKALSDAAQEQRTHRRRRVAMGATLGLAGAAGLTAGALFAAASQRIDDIGDACRKLPSGRCSAEQKQGALDAANIEAFELAMGVTSAVAATSLVTAGVLWIWDRRATRRMNVRIDARRVVLSGTF